MGKVVLQFSFIDQVLHFSKLGQLEEASVYRNKEDLPFHCMLPPENHLKRKAPSGDEHSPDVKHHCERSEMQIQTDSDESD